MKRNSLFFSDWLEHLLLLISAFHTFDVNLTFTGRYFLKELVDQMMIMIIIITIVIVFITIIIIIIIIAIIVIIIIIIKGIKGTQNKDCFLPQERCNQVYPLLYLISPYHPTRYILK